MQTRRQFLRDCSLVAATASVGPAVAWAGPREGRLADGLLFERFAGQLNTQFIVHTEAGTVKLTLVEVKPAPPAWLGAEDAGNERFSLLFWGSPRRPLTQDTYSFEHARLGRLAVFIVPIGCIDTSQRYYEAVFDHAVNPAELAAQLARAPAGETKN